MYCCVVQLPSLRQTDRTTARVGAFQNFSQQCLPEPISTVGKLVTGSRFPGTPSQGLLLCTRHAIARIATPPNFTFDPPPFSRAADGPVTVMPNFRFVY